LPENVIGKVFLVGAGPGDPKLLTLRAAEVLAFADVVLYDGLANLDLQDFLKVRLSRENGNNFPLEPSALAAGFVVATDPGLQTEASTGGSKWISVGKHGSQRIWKQSEINDTMVYHAKLGKTVVRLKGGDTGIFARTGEELERLVSESIPFEVVPGITAASAVAAYAGIPITHRDWASAVGLVTGHSQPSDGGPESDEAFDWAALARFPGTLVIYMGVTTVDDWSSRLMVAGKGAETPVALIRRCSWPDQETILCTLGEATEKLTPASKFRPPVLVIIGPVAHLGEPFDWFSKRPLAGKHILICRPTDDLDTTAAQLETLGATVYSQPALRIVPPKTWNHLDRIIDELDRYRWIVFSSRHGVRALLSRVYSRRKDSRVLRNCKLSGVGPSVGEELEKHHLFADYIALPPFGAKSLVAGFPWSDGTDSPSSQEKKGPILIVGNNRTDSFLADHFLSKGCVVESVCAYQSLAVPSPAPAITEKILSGVINYSLATSPAIAQTLVDWFGIELKNTRVASISPVVSKIFRSNGITAICEAQEPSIAGILQAIQADVTLELDKSAKAS